ncbi:N-acetylneuraminate synthase family protein [Pelagibacteraceae bacterium]|nr:N-acetylneuraminate synthase family protein [Pelagibacteraceae bacterium]
MPCYIIFEAGPTHQGFDSAKKLIHTASKAGADAIKFQMIDPNRIIYDRTQQIEFEVFNKKKGTIKKRDSLYKILKRRSLKFDEWRELKLLCDRLNICFICTAGFDDEIEFLKEIKCQSIKIASADVNHFPLIKKAAQNKVNIQIDTGSSTLSEIKEAVKIINYEGNNNIVIHHCPSGYPAKFDNINLNIIKTLKSEFKYPIGFSDHTVGYNMDIAALSIGANVIEKTITKSRKVKEIEHIMSLEISEAKNFIKVIRNVETAMGSYSRNLTNKEIISRSKIRRSGFLNKFLEKDSLVNSADIIYRRPGDGFSPDLIDTNTIILTKNVSSGDKLTNKNSKIVNKYKPSLNKIGIGTAQFGSKYGITNSKGATDYKNMENILNNAYDSGINFLDLADNYGNSISKLKKYFKKHPKQDWEICYKISGKINDLTYKLNQITKLIGTQPKTIMFHKFSQLMNYKKIHDLENFKIKNYLRLGCSLYYEKELINIIDNKIPIDIIQAPLNLLDKRFNDRDIIKKIKENNMEIYARSIFLQGLFFLNKQEIKKMFPKFNLHKFIYKNKNFVKYSIYELSLLWTLKCENIKKIILGFETNKQFLEILKIASLKSISQKNYNYLSNIKLEDQRIIIPSFWNTN